MIPETIPADNPRIHVRREVTTSIHAAGMVMVDSRSGRLFQSNAAGAVIWQGLEARLPLEAIAARICDRFEVALANAREHMARFLLELERQSLIEVERRM